MNELYSSKTDSDYFDYERLDIADYLQKLATEKLVSFNFNQVLDVGCGGGATGSLMKRRFPVKKYVGVELMPDVAKRAESKIEQVLVGDFEKMLSDKNLSGLDQSKFGLILFLDSLEHMYNPWEVIKQTKHWLEPDGHFVLSIPNAGHISVIKKLATDKFQYEKSGLLDFTHIRFFTFSTIKKMLDDNNCEIVAYTTSNDFRLPKIKLFNLLTFNLFKKLFIVSYTLIVRKKTV